MNKILIYILVAFIGTAGTWVANRFQLKKAIKPYKRHIECLQADSTLKLKKLEKLTADYTLKCSEDSLKSELISQKEKVLFDLNKIANQLKTENKALTAWKLDAQDGVITDTVTYKVNIFGKRKKVK